MGLKEIFQRKTDLGKTLEQQAYQKERMAQAENIGKARAMHEAKEKIKRINAPQQSGSGFRGFLQSTARNIQSTPKSTPMFGVMFAQPKTKVKKTPSEFKF